MVPSSSWLCNAAPNGHVPTVSVTSFGAGRKEIARCRRPIHESHADWIHRVREDATHAAHRHYTGAVGAKGARLGVPVDAAVLALFLVTEESHVPSFAPRVPPRVAEQPIWHVPPVSVMRLRAPPVPAIAHGQQGVVDDGVWRATVKDTGLVWHPVFGGRRHGHGPMTRNGVQQRPRLVRRQLHEAANGHRFARGWPNCANFSQCALPEANPVRLHVRKRQLCRCTIAAPSAAACSRVGDAVHEVLVGKHVRRMATKLQMHFHGARGRHRPTRATVALVADEL
mmetsp:Transcript_103208/g.291437  ORF Transcript_103208/g.291437 Transcript_103208/m.291437 type:complete len:283 (+) Transcript_103208:65-913(+)